jgi:sulfide:quinone oxidoreductase
MSSRRDARQQVVIAGGGVAALEALLALQALAPQFVDVTVLSPDPEFLYRPVTVAEAFERGEARAYQLDEIVGEQPGGEFICDSLAAVEPDDHVVVTGSGRRLPYDALIVATGALLREALPGAFTFRGRTDVPGLRAIIDDLVEGRALSVALALTSERMWPVPIYELALMTAAHVRERGASAVKVRIVTPEDEALALFGPAATSAVMPMLEARGIELRSSSLPVMVRNRMLTLAGGGQIPTDRVITLPRLEGPRLEGLPHDQQGFIPVDSHGRVTGLTDVYAAGDVTTFPLKQGGLAAQQADAIAELIAADVGAAITPAPFTPVLRGLLMTGGAPLYLRSEPHRMPRSASVAIEAHSSRYEQAGASSAAGQALWWPPAKIAGRFLAPYLATARPQPLAATPLADRVAVPGRALSDSEFNDALELALLLADCDARWGDYRSALSALDAAEALDTALPPEYELKRRHWRAALRDDR